MQGLGQIEPYVAKGGLGKAIAADLDLGKLQGVGCYFDLALQVQILLANLCVERERAAKSIATEAGPMHLQRR